jgi:hypothetical protein
MSFRLRMTLFAALIVVTLLTCAIYGQFLYNPAVFDDHNIITNLTVYTYAQTPFSTATRTLPYFSIGLVHVLSDGNLAWNRWFNIGLLGLIVVVLYLFLVRALTRFSSLSLNKLRGAALVTCLWFALNPVTVYAVGYLIQRSIVMATLFSIIAANLYLRAQQQERNLDLLSAGLLAALAMMCKEHAVLLPLATVALTPLVRNWDRTVALRAAGFLFLLVPVCYWTISHRSEMIGTNYEIYAGEALTQMTLPQLFDFAGGTWAMSIATQVGLFLKYAFSWFFPNPDLLSADIRIDFPAYWSGPWGVLGVVAVLITGLGALRITVQRNAQQMLRVSSAAFIYAAILYIVELSVVRVQEPFVLYRSFLWAPAYALVVCGFLLFCSQWLQARYRKVWLIFCVVVPLGCLSMIPWTEDRLQSFSSEEALWLDALQKLPSPNVAGADRIYYNLAGEAYKAKRFEEALQLSNRVINQNPQAFQGYLAKGTSLLALADAEGASQAFDEASVRPSPPEFRGYIQYKRCAVLELRGEASAIPDCLRLSAKLGYGAAQFKLQMMGLTSGS